jgi:hypothetical protein
MFRYFHSKMYALISVHKSVSLSDDASAGIMNLISDLILLLSKGIPLV